MAGDTRAWLGKAIPVREVWTISITGTWLTSETASITINGKTLTLTVGTTATVDQIGADIVDMINGAAANSDESRSALGTAVGEFTGLTAAYVAADDNITITGPEDGRPCGTISVADTSTSGALAVDGSTYTVAGDGPYHFSNASNWSTGVPVDGDHIVFDHRAASSLKYGLSPSSLTPASLTITSGFRYGIGLSEINKEIASYPYNEHQSTYLTLDGCTTVNIDASGAQGIKLNFGATASAIVVSNTGSTTESNVPPLLIKANKDTTTLTVTGGSVGLNYEPTTAGEIATAYVGGIGSPQLEIGNATTLATLKFASGKVVNNSAVTTVVGTGGTYEHKGGAITTVTLDSCTLTLASTGTITTLNAYNATIDASKDIRPRTITNTNLYARTVLKDPSGSITFTTGYKLYCKPTEVQLDLPINKTYTLS